MKRQCWLLVLVMILVPMLVGSDGDMVEKPSSSGCLIGSNHSLGGLISFSFGTGKSTSLIPQEIINDHFLYAPAVDIKTSTVYYVNKTVGAIIAYRIGDSSASRLYELPVEASRAIEWLLLHPGGERLFFLVSQELCEPDQLVEYDLQTETHRVIMSASFGDSQRPVWVDDSHLLLQEKYSLTVVDIHTGESVPLIEDVVSFAVSPNMERLLVDKIIQKEGSLLDSTTEFQLYEFPSLRFLQSVPEGLFAKFDSVRPEYCFVDAEHVVFLGSRNPLSTRSYLLDLRTFKYKKIARYIDGVSFLPECLDVKSSPREK